MNKNLPALSAARLFNPLSATTGVANAICKGSAATAVSLLMFSSASAMLPTPEPELENPTSTQTAAISAQNTVSDAPVNATANAPIDAPVNAPVNVAPNPASAIHTEVTAALVSLDANGQEVLAPITAQTQLQSGNVIEYQGYFTNSNSERVRKMTVTMTIPEQMVLIGEVAPEFAYGSADGDRFSRMPLRGRVDGQLQEIPLEYYKALRWDLQGIGLNDAVMVKYRARVK